MNQSLSIVLTLTVGFLLASLLAYIAKRLKLPIILGYLLAGYLIGPYSPGFVADQNIAEQLAEVGVVLMLFGVGLHFKIENLINVKNIAIPGAVIQTLLATGFSMGIVYALGYSLASGLIIGLSIAVASTVVLVRLLTENQLLDTVQGHVSVGWLVVEDILTVIVLILLPSIAAFSAGKNFSFLHVLGSIGFIGLKFAVLVLFMFTLGQKAISYALTKIAHLRSPELFTLTVLAFVFLIATASSAIFGASIALGAFIAGMVIGKTSVRYQAAANALPLKDVFTIIFFLSVGMLFNPMAIKANFSLFWGILFVVLAIKPLIAYVITVFLGYPLKIALTVAVALAQIGEFTFILAEESMNLNLLSKDMFDLLIACALISISLNPLLFQTLDFLEKKIQRFTRIKRPLKHIEKGKSFHPKIVVVGFGPIGSRISTIFKAAHADSFIIEENIDKVMGSQQADLIMYGDAADESILKDAHIAEASHLFITIADIEKTLAIIRAARLINSNILIVARIQYLLEKPFMEELHVDYVCSEEEVLKSFTSLIYRQFNKGVI